MNRFERWSLWTTAIATTATGVVYFWMKYLVHGDDPWAVINHPLQGVILKAHIVAAPSLVFAVGLITARHIWVHYRQGLPLGRRSGTLTALVTMPMVITGYLIQTITHPIWLNGIALSHIGLGFVFAVGLAVHFSIVRRRARRAQPGSWFDVREAAPAAERAPKTTYGAASGAPELFSERRHEVTSETSAGAPLSSHPKSL
jgi:hypothetical protein